jgi:hypothetical protein
MYKVFSLCAIFVMEKIWRAFQNKLAKLLEFSLGERKKIPFFCSEKEHYLFMANGTSFFYVQFL